MRSATGLLQVTDALALRDGAGLAQEKRAGRGELIRIATVLDGRVRLRVEIEPRGGGILERDGSGYRLRASGRGDLELDLRSSRPLDGVVTRLDLAAGERLELGLSWGSEQAAARPDEALDATLRAWRRWSERITYDGPQAGAVRRSVFTIKALDYFENGAIVAAPTSSLPESIGGGRNWDYRYAWIRDAAFSVYALHRRYRLEESPGGLAGHEGAFLLCSFWLVDNLALQGRLEEAHEIYDSLCARGGALGLLPEEIDPSTGAFLGNYPQAFSHIGLISSGVNLARCLRARETFAEVVLHVDNWRWAGVPFRLRTGKALRRSRREIAVRFEPVPHLVFGSRSEPRPNLLRLSLDPDRIGLTLNINGPGDPCRLEEVELDTELAPQDLPAYARLLLDVLEGDATLSIRGDEAEECWQIVEPDPRGLGAGPLAARRVSRRLGRSRAARDRQGPALIGCSAMGSLLACVAAGLVPAGEAFTGFGPPAVVTGRLCPRARPRPAGLGGGRCAGGTHSTGSGWTDVGHRLAHCRRAAISASRPRRS